MTIVKDLVSKILCIANDFCKVNGLAPQRDKGSRKYNWDGTISDAEVITIMILFHLCRYKCLKLFYMFIKKCCMEPCTSIGFVDGTALRVCRNQRIHLHRVFRDLARRGHDSPPQEDADRDHQQRTEEHGPDRAFQTQQVGFQLHG